MENNKLNTYAWLLKAEPDQERFYIYRNIKEVARIRKFVVSRTRHQSPIYTMGGPDDDGRYISRSPAGTAGTFVTVDNKPLGCSDEDNLFIYVESRSNDYNRWRTWEGFYLDNVTVLDRSEGYQYTFLSGSPRLDFSWTSNAKDPFAEAFLASRERIQTEWGHRYMALTIETDFDDQDDVTY